jgi:hypothetical protein
MKRVASIAVASLCLVSSAGAQSRAIYMTGEELQAVCLHSPDICEGYVAGIADALESFRPPLPSTCRSKEVPLQAVVEFAIETLSYSLTDLRRPAMNILADAFSAKWPC